MELTAAILEGWARARLGKSSIACLALVLGRLCNSYDVDPSLALQIARSSRDASRDFPELKPS